LSARTFLETEKLIVYRKIVFEIVTGRIEHNGTGLCVRAGNRSKKAEFITKVQLKNCRSSFALQPA
jgi:hypothetical protein